MDKKNTDKKNLSKLFAKNNLLSKRNIIIFLIIIIMLACLIFIFTRNNDSAAIELKTRANEIYEWQYKIDDTSVVKFEKKQRFGDIEGKKKDGSITERYIFKAFKPGKTSIKFIYTNTKNKSYTEVKEYRVNVDKKLNLAIKEQ